ncbi:MAG: helix-turn-helix domain-containing protein, partial [Verrucomicrobiales bacterium]
KYRADDKRVIDSGKPLMNIVELFPGTDGTPDWSVTDKLPLFDTNGEVCGVCGTVRTYEGARTALAPYLELQPAVDYLKKHFRDKLNVEKLAELVGVSVRQLERKFREFFKMSPRAYLIRLRVLIACELLKQTSKQVTEIALEVGFYDHSDFSRHFKKVVGQSPTQFRKESLGA